MAPDHAPVHLTLPDALPTLPADGSDSERRTLMVASTGGHLAELVRLSPRLEQLPDRRLWVTFDTIQSQTLLADEDALFVPFTAPRDVRRVVANARHARAILNAYPVSAVVSTGAGIAGSFLPLASRRGIPTHYIECSARTHGPSATGRLLGLFRGVQRYTQFERWSNQSWRYPGSVFDTFDATPRVEHVADPLRVVVTVGTLSFSFRRLFSRLLEILPPDAEVLWQTGQTPVDDLPLVASPFVAPDVLDAAMRRADVVIAHAGIGSALASLDAGRPPILVPRLKRHAEHVDDHQLEIAQTLSDRGIASNLAVGDLDLESILAVAGRRVRISEGRPLSLSSG